MPEWLTIVGQVLVGAGLLSAIAAYLLREYELTRERKRELRGLLRFVAAEMHYNMRVLNAIHEDPTMLEQVAEGGYLRTVSWEESSTRLAQLIKDDQHFSVLAHHYEVIWAIKNPSPLWLIRTTKEAQKEQTRREQIDGAVQSHSLAKEAIEQELKECTPAPTPAPSEN